MVKNPRGERSEGKSTTGEPQMLGRSLEFLCTTLKVRALNIYISSNDFGIHLVVTVSGGVEGGS